MKNNELIAEYIKNQKINSTILYTAFTNTARKYCARIEDYGFFEVNFTQIQKGFNPKELAIFDVIANHGGNPYNIRDNMEISGYLEYLRATNQLIVTTSGSSLALSNRFDIYKTLYPKMKGNDPWGLNLFPYEIIPHFHRYRKKMKLIKEYSKGKQVYAISDGSAIAYDGKKIEIIGDVSLI